MSRLRPHAGTIVVFVLFLIAITFATAERTFTVLKHQEQLEARHAEAARTVMSLGPWSASLVFMMAVGFALPAWALLMVHLDRIEAILEKLAHNGDERQGGRTPAVQ